jgi:hypothetical protein
MDAERELDERGTNWGAVKGEVGTGRLSGIGLVSGGGCLGRGKNVRGYGAAYIMI